MRGPAADRIGRAITSALGAVVVALLLVPGVAFAWTGRQDVSAVCSVEREASDVGTATLLVYTRTSDPSAAALANGTWDDSGWTLWSTVQLDPEVKVYEWYSGGYLTLASVGVSGAVDIMTYRRSGATPLSVAIRAVNLTGAQAGTLPVSVVTPSVLGTVAVSNFSTGTATVTVSSMPSVSLEASSVASTVTLSGLAGDAITPIVGLSVVCAGVWFGRRFW